LLRPLDYDSRLTADEEKALAAEVGNLAERSNFKKRRTFDSIYELYLKFMENRNYKPKDQNNDIVGIAYIIALHDDEPRDRGDFMASLRVQGAAVTEDDGIDWIYPSVG